MNSKKKIREFVLLEKSTPRKVESLDTIEPIATSVLCQFMTIKTFSK